MTTRTITGTLPRFPDSTITFALLELLVQAGGTYPRRTQTATLGGAGELSVALDVPDSGAARWRVTLPDGTVHDFNLPAGAPTTLETILLGSFLSASPDVVLALLA